MWRRDGGKGAVGRRLRVGGEGRNGDGSAELQRLDLAGMFAAPAWLRDLGGMPPSGHWCAQHPAPLPRAHHPIRTMLRGKPRDAFARRSLRAGASALAARQPRWRRVFGTGRGEARDRRRKRQPLQLRCHS
jgi:hypothetical protein